jgi:hypothetical protein
MERKLGGIYIWRHHIDGKIEENDYARWNKWIERSNYLPITKMDLWILFRNEHKGPTTTRTMQLSGFIATILLPTVPASLLLTCWTMWRFNKASWFLWAQVNDSLLVEDGTRRWPVIALSLPCRRYESGDPFCLKVPWFTGTPRKVFSCHWEAWRVFPKVEGLTVLYFVQPRNAYLA